MIILASNKKDIAIVLFILFFVLTASVKIDNPVCKAP